MEYYEKIIRDKLEELVKYGGELDSDVAERWLKGNTEDDFGNLSGCRIFDIYKIKHALFESGFPFDEGLLNLLEGAGYDLSIMKKGPEAVDVIICELLAPIVAQDVLDEIEMMDE